MAFHVAGAHGDRGDGRGEPDLVPRIADGARVAVSERLDHAQVELLGWTRVAARAMGDEQVVGAEEVDGLIDLFERRHAGGQDHRPARRPDRLEQRGVGQGRGRDLVRHDVELLEELHRLLVPG